MSKGFDGWIALVPETKGWGSSVYAKGNFLHVDSEALHINKEFKERPEKIVFGRSLKPSSRVSGQQNPGGELTFQPRSDDCLPALAAHFQNYTATSLGGTASGTVQYTFTPAKTEPNWLGSAFGTGVYGADPGDMFTVGVVKKIFNTTQYGGTNGFKYSSGIVDSLEMTMAPNDDLKFKLGMKFYSVDAGTKLGTLLDPPLGTTMANYSTKTSFMSWTGTLTVAGEALGITGMTTMLANNSEVKNVIGRLNPIRFPQGRYGVEGSFEVDLPKDGLKWIGSMLANSPFALTGTFYNSDFDQVAFSIPNARYKTMELDLKGGAAETVFSIPFVGYESEDGSESPITVVVTTTGWGTSLDNLG